MKEPILMEDKVGFYIDKAIECYSGHAITDEWILSAVMTLSKGSINPHDVMKTIASRKKEYAS
jgi:hypothetical protein